MAAVWKATIYIHKGKYSTATEKVELKTDSKDTSGKLSGNITISSNTSYTCTIHSLYLHKEIYSPNKIELSIDVNTSDVSTFVSKFSSDGRITIYVTTIIKKESKEEEVSTPIVENYPIFNISTSFTNNAISTLVNLTAYSPDKCLTLDKYCRAYTNRSIGGNIIQDEFKGDGSFESILENYEVNKLDFESFAFLQDETDDELSARQTDGSNAVRHLKSPFYHLTPFTGNLEPAMPYLVQYNESFYDFMRRTLYRCGEYMFFDDNEMHFGLGTAMNTQVTFSADKTESNTLVYLYTSSCTSTSIRNFSTCNYNYQSANERGSYEESISQNSELQQLAFMEAQYEEFTSWDFWMMDLGLNSLTTFTVMVKAINSLITSESLTKCLSEYITEFAKIGLEHIPTIESPEVKIKLDCEENKKNVFDELKKLYKELKNSHPLTKNDNNFYVNVQKAIEDVNSKAITLEQSSVYQNVFLGNTISGKGIVNEITIDYKYDGSKVAFSQQVKVVPLYSDNTPYPAKYDIPLVRLSGPQHAFVVGTNEKAEEEKEYLDVKTGTSADPANLHRVTVRYPWQRSEDDMSPLLRMAVPMATKYGGFSFIPRDGDEAIINYDFGNIELPYIEGMVCNSANWSYTNYENGYTTAITSPNGHSITFNDPPENTILFDYLAKVFPLIKTPPVEGLFDTVIEKLEERKGKRINGKITKFVSGDLAKDLGAKIGDTTFFRSGGMTLSDMNGLYSISMDSDKRAIDISSPLGTVSINALTGISIDAPVGDVSIRGRNVNIVANDKLTLKSGAKIREQSDDLGLYRPFDKLSFWGEAAFDILDEGIVGPITSVINTNSLINLSAFRYLFDLFFSPIDGTLTLSSPRYLAIQQGQGKIDFDKIYYSQKDDKDHLLHNVCLWSEAFPETLKGTKTLMDSLKEKAASINQQVTNLLNLTQKDNEREEPQDIIQMKQKVNSTMTGLQNTISSSNINKVKDLDKELKEMRVSGSVSLNLLDLSLLKTLPSLVSRLCDTMKEYNNRSFEGKIKDHIIDSVKQRNSTVKDGVVESMVEYVFIALNIDTKIVNNFGSMSTIAEIRLPNQEDVTTYVQEQIQDIFDKVKVVDATLQGQMSWSAKVDDWVKKYEDSLKPADPNLKDYFKDKAVGMLKGIVNTSKEIKAVACTKSQTTFKDSAFDKFHKPRIIMSTEKGKVHYIENGEIREYTMNYSRYFAKLREAAKRIPRID